MQNGKKQTQNIKKKKRIFEMIKEAYTVRVSFAKMNFFKLTSEIGQVKQKMK